MRVNILGVKFDNVSFDAALKKILEFLDSDGHKAVYTPNPEFVMEAQKDSEFMASLKSGDLVTPDGIGIIIGSRILKTPLRQRVGGCDLMFALFGAIKTTGHSVYLLGGKPGVAELAKKNMERQFPGLRIVGTHHGYFGPEQDAEILAELEGLRPDILMLCVGFPRAEKWIYKYKSRLPVKVSACTGGTIDIMAGTVKRAPEVFQRVGMEWFYRLVTQPSRFKRMLKLPLFVIKVLIERVKGTN